MKTTLAALALSAATLLGSGAAQATENTVVATATQTQPQAAQPAQPQAANPLNFFDPSSWFSGTMGNTRPGEMAEFDPANPKDWAKMVDPKTHNKVHMTLMNPQYYARFMTPAYYMKFMDPKTWFGYMDMASYEPLLKVSTDAKTYTYWANPGSYMHMMDPGMYMQMADPNAYVKMAGDVAKGYGAETTGSTADLFNPFAWMKMFAEAAAPITQTASAEQKKTQ